MAINTNYGQAGLASIQKDDVTGAVELFAGDTPAPVTISASVPAPLATAGIAAFTPVRVNFEDDTVQLAVQGTLAPNAITAVEIPAGSAVGKVPVYKAGSFNINALVWPASFDLEAERLQAFDLATSQIFVKKPFYA